MLIYISIIEIRLMNLKYTFYLESLGRVILSIDIEPILEVHQTSNYMDEIYRRIKLVVD